MRRAYKRGITMIICNACGTRAEDDDIFCPNCGARLDTSLKSKAEISHSKMAKKVVMFIAAILAVALVNISFMQGNITILLPFLALLVLGVFTLWTSIADRLFALFFHQKMPLWLKIIGTIMIALVIIRIL